MFRKKTLLPYLGQKINIWSTILLSTVVGVRTYRHTRRHLTKYYKLNNHSSGKLNSKDFRIQLSTC